MKPGHSKTTDEAQIRERLDRWVKAVRAKDIDAVMDNYAPTIVLFDLVPPLHYSGLAACRKNWSDWFPTFQGPVGYEISDLQVTADNEVAFCHSLNHIRGTRTAGEDTDVWIRASVGLQKLDGEWRITHEHYSVPFYMNLSEKAALDLQP